MYQIFNTSISSEFPLPELPECDGVGAAIYIRLDDSSTFDDRGFEVAFEWFDPSGSVNCWVERRLQEYLFVFPGVVRFFVGADWAIVCLPNENCSIQTVRHLLLNQVVPRVIAAKGSLVLHASAVTLENGRSYAFLGNSGFGKSTLASSFHNSGARLISDDCLLLQSGPDGISAFGGMPGIRLFEDSQQAVFGNSDGFSEYTPYTEKQQMIAEQKLQVSVPNSVPINAVFVLNDPSSPNPGNNVTIKPLGGSGAMAAMINCSFCLDPSNRTTLVNNFKSLGKLVDGQVAFYSLSYPRDLSQLNLVKEAVSVIGDGK